MKRCGDCDEWAMPTLGGGEMQAFVDAALLVHAFVSHADLVHERTGLKLELIEASVTATVQALAGDPDLDGLSGVDFDLVGRVWAAAGDSEKLAEIVKRLTPAGVRVLTEVSAEARVHAKRLIAEAQP
jgi:hypothetical protein